MIEKHYEKLEEAIQFFKNIQFYTWSKKIYNDRRGYIEGTIVFVDKSLLEFAVYTDLDDKNKLKYRYHYMDGKNNLIFRYDNAPHHKEIRTFPHHKHLKNKVVESTEITLFEVLSEVDKYMRQKSSGSRQKR